MPRIRKLLAAMFWPHVHLLPPQVKEVRLLINLITKDPSTTTEIYSREITDRLANVEISV